MYHHPLFHRDRPQDLKKLRRRTCPGFDGRKQKGNRTVDDANQGIFPETSTDPAAKTSSIIVSPESAVKVSRSPSPSSQVSVEPKIESNGIPFYRSISSTSTESLATAWSSSFQSKETELSGEQFENCVTHLQTVAQVSRDLNLVCSKLSSSKAMFRGVATNDVCFGLDKSAVHYSKIKCDLLTYDDEVFDEEEEERAVLAKPFVSAPPNDCEDSLTPTGTEKAVIDSIIDACYDGRLFNAADDEKERQVSSNILKFLLTTYPRDEMLQDKIAAHLRSHPILEQKFHAYTQVLDGSDSERDYITFALNVVRPILHTNFQVDNCTALSENVANVIQKCIARWF